MFSWICARCGHDNPPSATVCSRCGARFDEPAETPAASAVEPAAVEPQPPAPVTPAPASTAPMPPPRRDRTSPAPRRSGIPTWLMTVLAFFAIVGIGSAIYYGVTWFSSRKQATSTGLDPAANAARAKLSSPLQKYIEVVGIRLTQDRKRSPEARFVIVNHSPDTFDNLTGTVTIWASTQRSEEDSVGTFRFKVAELGPFEAKDDVAPLSTKLKFYELPDWQNVNPEIQITAP